MTYGTKQFKNGKQVGYLHFDSGKKVYLNSKEVADFQNKVRYWQDISSESYGSYKVLKLTAN